MAAPRPSLAKVRPLPIYMKNLQIKRAPDCSDSYPRRQRGHSERPRRHQNEYPTNAVASTSNVPYDPTRNASQSSHGAEDSPVTTSTEPYDSSRNSSRNSIGQRTDGTWGIGGTAVAPQYYRV